MSDRVCKFCGCRTNAARMRCCENGAEHDRLVAELAQLRADLSAANLANAELRSRVIQLQILACRFPKCSCSVGPGNIDCVVRSGDK